jgi:hypothetical protein
VPDRHGRHTLGQASFRKLLRAGKHREIAAQAVAIEARTNLLFSFEKMALRDGIKSPAGARTFAQGLYDFLHGTRNMEERFTRLREAVAALPRRQTRVLTWPVVTAFAVRKDLPDLHPRDMIDIQSFLWVQGSDEYPDRG